MDTYHKYFAKRMYIEAELEEERRAIRDQVLTDLRACVKEFRFSVEDVFPDGAPKKKRLPKYYDPVTGATWSGNGKEPVWLRGKDRAQYLLSKSARAK
ncbi:H-NS histone family protein [Burkholderia ambifaria]|uniref:H-NS histone family protein n=1 Tax=Burkholderia ambifaria TaxID=152480 RepID=UPI001E47A418|nr:H-NS histone family protein [Burkholderia ambifaria]UEP23079.1 H-NS histone family protein [Burkholderia ambifaria]UEP39824.1 H-NS histone family protein [Burkholderia ambifaria]